MKPGDRVELIVGCGEEDHGDVRSVLLDGCADCESVALPERDVEEHELIGMQSRCGYGEFDGTLLRVRGVDVIARLDEELGESLDDEGVVFDQKDAG